MVAQLKKPKRVMILVKGWPAVDSEYQDTVRRVKDLEDKGILFVSGVSGGEEGESYGPSLMPDSNPGAWAAIKPIFQAICAKIREDSFCDWEGEGDSGHLVKMVNNSIEYGDMQLMQKAYDLMQV